jgi:hypothetical protein
MPIEIYKNNTLSFDVSIYGISDVSGYIPYYTVKKNLSDTIPSLTVTGIIKDSSGTARFFLSSTDSSIVPNTYITDVTLEKDGSIFTIIKDTLEIKQGVRW